MTTHMIDVVSGKADEGDDVMAVRMREHQDDFRAAVTAVLPSVRDGVVISPSDMSAALSAAGIGTGTDRDLALITGAVQCARAFVLLAEALEADPAEVWESYVGMSA